MLRFACPGPSGGAVASRDDKSAATPKAASSTQTVKSSQSDGIVRRKITVDLPIGRTVVFRTQL